jgi:alanine dehydrogenase
LIRVPNQYWRKTLIVGLPKEIKDNEYRVGLTPAGVRALKDAGHQIMVERDAGAGSCFEN